MAEIVYQVNEVMGIWSGYLTNFRTDETPTFGYRRMIPEVHPVPLMLYPGNLIFWNPITLIDGYKLGGIVTKVGINYRWSKNPLIFKPIKQNTTEEWRTLGYGWAKVFQNGEWFRLADAERDGIISDVTKVWNRNAKIEILLNV